MQIVPFPAHYQSVYTNFDISSFSLISCTPTVALPALKCGSFASLKSPDEKSRGLFRWIEAGLPFWLENFCGGVFVDIICRCPISCEGTFSLTSVYIYLFFLSNIDSSEKYRTFAGVLR